MSEEAEIKYWLALSRLKAHKQKAALRGALLGGGPKVLFGDEGFSFVPPLPSSLETALKSFDDWSWVDRELRLMKEAGVRLITLLDTDYPSQLKEIPDPPFYLYARGGLSLGAYGESLAIVGTRRPTHYGLRLSETLARDMASLGALIVSGMARGCDMAAHKGALGVGGATVAVLGTGVDVCYPAEARGIYEELGVKGLLVSEFPMGTGPKPYNFPRRNRIISGLSRGVLVVEAPLRSGAMMTSRLALEHNRDVFAVPGPVTSYKSKGPNSLIKDGAVLVEDAGDILAAWGSITGLSANADSQASASSEGGQTAPPPLGAGNEALVFKALEEGPLSIDEIAATCGLKVQALGGILLEMELKGLVSQRPGKVFVRRF